MNKNIKNTITVILVLSGLAFGPGMLESAYAAHPPFDWGSVILCFVGVLIGLPFVIGLQLIRSNPKFAKSAILVFGPISIFIFSSGVSAFGFGVYKEGITPQSTFFLACGTAMLIAMGFCRVLYEIKEHAFQSNEQSEP